MTIAIDVTRAIIETAGIGRHIRELVRKMIEIDEENDYVILSTHFRNSTIKQEIFDSFKRKNTTLKRIPIPGRTKEILWGLKVNWLKFFGISADRFFATSIFEVGLGFKIPQILVIYDMTTFIFPAQRGEKLSEFLNERTTKTCKLSSKIIAISQSTKHDLLKYVKLPEEKVTMIYPGLNKFKGIADKLPNGVEAKKYILAVGTVEPRKNLVGLFKAYAALDEPLREQYPLLVAGGKGWRDSEIYATAEELVQKNQIRFLGFVEDSVLAKLYQEARVFAYPSFYEGFGFPVLEAMSFGQAVITSNISSMPEVCGEAGILIDPNQTETISEALKKILTDDTLREALSSQAVAQANRFSWEKSAAETIKLLG